MAINYGGVIFTRVDNAKINSLQDEDIQGNRTEPNRTGCVATTLPPSVRDKTNFKIKLNPESITFKMFPNWSSRKNSRAESANVGTNEPLTRRWHWRVGWFVLDRGGWSSRGSLGRWQALSLSFHLETVSGMEPCGAGTRRPSRNPTNAILMPNCPSWYTRGEIRGTVQGDDTPQ
jgi:hypothetical protein